MLCAVHWNAANCFEYTARVANSRNVTEQNNATGFTELEKADINMQHVAHVQTLCSASYWSSIAPRNLLIQSFLAMKTFIAKKLAS